MFYRKFVFGEFEEDQGGEARIGGECQNGEAIRNGEGTGKTGGSQSEGNVRKTDTGRNGALIQEVSGGQCRQDVNQQKTIRVRAGDLYRPDTGYGFVVEKNRREQELLRLPELNAAFDALYWCRNEELSHVEEDRNGCFLDSDREIEALEETAGGAFPGERRRIPLSFKLDVPRQGNYRATVRIRTRESMEDVLIFTGRRRLGYRGAVSASAGVKAEIWNSGDRPADYPETQVREIGPDEMASLRSREAADGLKEGGDTKKAGEAAAADTDSGIVAERAGSGDFICTMSVNVCDIIPRGLTEVYTDRSLDITILAKKPGISEITVEELECPTLFIAGDSTVTDQSADYPYAPGTSYSGWGQMISGYLSGKIAVSNHAHSGLTTASFREEGHYGIVERYIRPGDYLFIQFAHNDQKLESLKAEEGYRRNLLRYIGECRARGAFPVLVTPIARNTWKGNDGSYNDLLEEYAGTCISVGEQEDVPVLDLHRRSMNFIVKKGLEASKAYFFPGDYTHSNDYGAYFMAGLVADEIAGVCGERKEPEYRFLAEQVTEGFGGWPPAERIVPLEKPAVYDNVEDPKETEALSDMEHLSEPADRASALDMVIRTARFFPTNVYNDMFTDVVGHEWYAGAVECAYQNGMIDPGMVEDGKFFPLRPVTLEEFLVFAVNGYKSRRKLPDMDGCADNSVFAYDTKCREFTKLYVRAACALGLIPSDGSETPDRVLTRGEAVAICRKLGL